MSRSGYTDDDDPLAMGRYRHTVDRAIRGPRVQALLFEMVEALDAMPKRELAADVFVEGENMCAMGVVAVARGIDSDKLRKLDEHDPDEVGKLLDIPACVAREIAYENDEWARGDDEDRWRHMKKWAESNIIDRKPTPTGTCAWCCKSFTVRYGVINRHRWLGGPCPGAGQPACTQALADQGARGEP